MRQTTIWDFLPQESSIEAKQTNQRNIMQFESLEEILDYIRRTLPTSGSVDTTEPFTQSAEEHNSDVCLDCQLDYLESKETLLLANVNVVILDVMMNTLNQKYAIRNEQADTLVKLAQVRTMLLGAN